MRPLDNVTFHVIPAEEKNRFSSNSTPLNADLTDNNRALRLNITCAQDETRFRPIVVDCCRRLFYERQTPTFPSMNL